MKGSNYTYKQQYSDFNHMISVRKVVKADNVYQGPGYLELGDF